jgi:hypothetical protein
MWRHTRPVKQQKRHQRYTTIYNEHSPSRQVDSSPVSKVFSGNLMEPERSLPCVQHPATLPNSKPDESSLCLPTVSLTHEPSYLFPHLPLIHQTVQPASSAILRQLIVQTRSSNPKCLTQHCITTEFRLDFFSEREKYLQLIVSEFERWSWGRGGVVKVRSRHMSAETEENYEKQESQYQGRISNTIPPPCYKKCKYFTKPTHL